VPPVGVLGELVAAAVARSGALKSQSAELETSAGAQQPSRSFLGALQGPGVAVIAELKRASPSKGAINAGLDVAAHARAYQRGGAAAISVLTEPTRFGGSIADLEEVRGVTSCPLLRKDFIVDELQILEARAAGASAVLLIVRALDPSRLAQLFRSAAAYGLDALVEVRDASELEAALSVGATIIGVNNRNLETLEVDDSAAGLLPLIPRRCTAVAESGYRNAADVSRAAAAGADAVLVGSELSSSPFPEKLIAQFAAIPRSRDARPN